MESLICITDVFIMMLMTVLHTQVLFPYLSYSLLSPNKTDGLAVFSLSVCHTCVGHISSTIPDGNMKSHWWIGFQGEVHTQEPLPFAS